MKSEQVEKRLLKIESELFLLKRVLELEDNVDSTLRLLNEAQNSVYQSRILFKIETLYKKEE